METIDLWLDDERSAPAGWVHVKTVEEAKRHLERGNVLNASLDHDLGECDTGYMLVCWMEETGKWPWNKPTVHSANPAGRSKMLAAIERHYSIQLR
jgi:hypothetical protein